MNTSEVAKLLGVSASTIQRWVKQLELPMERNERGHYFFNQEDIDLLKTIQEQIQQGTLLQDMNPPQTKKARRGVRKENGHDQLVEKLSEKVSELELSLHAKADSVASYQLLQHRREIEELQNQVKRLTDQLTILQNQISESKTLTQVDKPLVYDSTNSKKKKKNIVRSLFGI